MIIGAVRTRRDAWRLPNLQCVCSRKDGMPHPGRSVVLNVAAKLGAIAIAVAAVAVFGATGLLIAIPAVVALALLILLGPGGMLD
ncbi:MAG: hypothetical protein ACR2N6_09645 [Miltoncostaeaceae bacterium]